MKRVERIQLKIAHDSDPEDDEEDEEDVAYLTLPDHPGHPSARVKNTLRLRDHIGDYVGPDLFFDFDEENKLIGIEILD